MLDLRRQLTRHRRVPNAVAVEELGEGSQVWINFGINLYEHARVTILPVTIGAHGLIGRIVGGASSARAQLLGATPGRRIRFLRGQALRPAPGWEAAYRGWDELDPSP